MSHRMTVMTRGLMLLMSLCLLSDVGEAGQRRRRARYCQPTCCQPQPVCCQPAACAPAPTDMNKFCAWWKCYTFGTVCYYYSPHCRGTMTPIMIAAGCDACMEGNNCDNDACCVPDGTQPLSKTGSALVRKPNAHAKPAATLESPLPANHGGPENVNGQFVVTRVNENENGPDKGWYYVKFRADGRDVVAKCAEYIVFKRDVRTPVLLVAHGHEVQGHQGQSIQASHVEGVVGNSKAFYVTIPAGQGHPQNPELTFLTMIQ